MVQLVQPKITKVITKNGECEISISLDININLNEGNVSLIKNIDQKSEESHSDKVDWEIPQFKSNNKIKFGE